MQSETWGAMEDLVAKGLVKHIGICNVMVKQKQSISSSNTWFML